MSSIDAVGKNLIVGCFTQSRTGPVVVVLNYPDKLIIILVGVMAKVSIIVIVLITTSSILPYISSLASQNHLKKQKPLRQRKDFLDIERQLRRSRGFRYIIGSDDSGRGCIAGPVVTASCCIICSGEDQSIIPFVDDSKLLSKNTRDQIYATIVNRPDCFVWSTAIRSNQDIDKTSLDQAVNECFQESIDGVVQQLQLISATDFSLEGCYSIVDGHSSPKVKITSRPWKGGDKIVYSVALASIIARVCHEQIMSNYTLFPGYGFERHFGYPSRSHINALHQNGPSPIHRKSCKPVKRRLLND